MKQVFFAIVAVLLLSLPAFAMTKEEKMGRFQDCSKIKNDKDRKACLKSLVDDEVAAAKEEETQEKNSENSEIEKNKSKWRIIRDKSEFDDSKKINALLFGECPVKDCPVLVLRCKENKTDIFITWEEILPFGNDYPIVEYRIDSKKSVKATTNISGDNKATFFRNPIQIIKELTPAKKMVARTYLLNNGMRSVSFDLTGIEEVAKELSATCNWKLE